MKLVNKGESDSADLVVRELNRLVSEDGKSSSVELCNSLGEGCVVLGGSTEETVKELDVGIVRLDSNCQLDAEVMVGMRNYNREEFSKFREKRVFNMKKIFELGIKEVTDLVMENARGFERLYLSVNLSVLDPAFVAGKGHVGGLTSRELIYVIQRMKLLKNLKYVDFVGFCNEDAKLVARMIKELE
jgi:arginase family enzyme